MALADLTNHNPFQIDRSANIRAAQSFGDSIGAGINQFVAARDKAEERRRLDEERKEVKRQANLEIEAREQTKATDTFGSLIEESSNTGAIGQGLQELAYQDKKTFIEYAKKIREPGTTDEQRAEYRTQMDQLGQRAKTTASALNKLNENADAWNQLIQTEGISDATPKPIREFMQDIIKRENEDGYQVIDEDGRTKLVGTTSEGSPVDFYLDEVAGGANSFRAIPKFNKDDYIQGLVESIPQEVEVVENEYGLAQQNNAKLMGEKAATAVMDSLKGEDTFRAISADYGFDYNDLELLDSGEGLPLDTSLSEEEIAKIDKDGDGFITNRDELQGYLANQLLVDLSEQLPTGFKQVDTSKYKQDIQQTGPGAKTTPAAVRTANFKQQQATEQYEAAKSYLRPFRGAGGEFKPPTTADEAKMFERAFGAGLPVGYTAEYSQSRWNRAEKPGELTIFDKSGNEIQSLDPSDTQGMNNFLSKITGAGFEESGTVDAEKIAGMDAIVNQ